MKKVLALFLVLGLAAVAQAAVSNDLAIVQISVDGQAAPPIIDPPLVESEWIKLDIMLAPGYYTTGFDLDLEIIGKGSIDVQPVINPVVDSWILGVVLVYDDTGIQKFQAGAYTMLGEPAAEGQLIDGIWFHCDGPSLDPVIVRLTSNDVLNIGTDPDQMMEIPQSEAGEYLGEILIPQIPEPLTLGLLGLGGLGLLRRRR